jgi:hypothetical protein
MLVAEVRSRLQQLLLGDHLTGAQHEGLEKGDLAGGQLDLHPSRLTSRVARSSGSSPVWSTVGRSTGPRRASARRAAWSAAATNRPPSAAACTWPSRLSTARSPSGASVPAIQSWIQPSVAASPLTAAAACARGVDPQPLAPQLEAVGVHGLDVVDQVENVFPGK